MPSFALLRRNSLRVTYSRVCTQPTYSHKRPPVQRHWVTARSASSKKGERRVQISTAMLMSSNKSMIFTLGDLARVAFGHEAQRLLYVRVAWGLSRATRHLAGVARTVLHQCVGAFLRPFAAPRGISRRGWLLIQLLHLARLRSSALGHAAAAGAVPVQYDPGCRWLQLASLFPKLVTCPWLRRYRQPLCGQV